MRIAFTDYTDFLKDKLEQSKQNGLKSISALSTKPSDIEYGLWKIIFNANMDTYFNDIVKVKNEGIDKIAEFIHAENQG